MWNEGDEVCVVREHEPHFITKIDRVTRTQAICNTLRFERETGRQIGGGYPHLAIREVTQEDRNKIRKSVLADRLTRRGDWKLLPLETLEAIWAMVSKIQQPQSSRPTGLDRK